CTWYPVEEVHAFLWAARQAKEVLELDIELRGPEQEELRHAIQEASSAAELGARHWRLVSKDRALTDMLTSHLTIHGQYSLKVVRFPDMRRPETRALSNIGFLPAVWSEIRHMICEGPPFLRCADDFCRKLFFPTRKGQKYCDSCREGNHAASRMSQQRRRTAP